MKNLNLILVFIFLAACNKSTHRNNEITKIEFARMGAWSDGGAAININSSLIYNYYHGVLFKEGDYFTGKITQLYWDSLNQKFEQAKYKTIDTTDNDNTVDVPVYEIIISWKNGKKRIQRIKEHDAKDSITAVLNWLNDSYKIIKLRKANTPIKFETTFQNPPPKPKVNRAFFPPSVNKN